MENGGNEYRRYARHRRIRRASALSYHAINCYTSEMARHMTTTTLYGREVARVYTLTGDVNTARRGDSRQPSRDVGYHDVIQLVSEMVN